MGSKTVPIILVVLSLYGIALNEDNKLIPVFTILTSPSDKGPSIGSFAVAMLIVLGFTSFLDDSVSVYLIGLIGLSAIAYDYRINGSSSMIPSILNKGFITQFAS